MDNSALRKVTSFPPPNLRLFPWPRLSPVKPAAHEPDPAEVFATIRRQIESGQQTPGAVLNAIVVVAQALTGATGAAIAMRQEGRAVCVARSGETAPEIGDPVNTESGISSACLRSGKILLCDDTELDPRVDAQVCRQLGLRSIATAPIREAGQVVGILEIFSLYAYAFSQQHMSFLQSMAELAEAAHAQDVAENLADIPAPEPPAPLVDIAPEYPLEEALRRLPNLLPVAQKRPYWIMGVVAFALIVLVSTVWQIWHQPRPDSETSARLADMPAASAAAEPTSHDLQESSAVVQRHQQKQAEHRRKEREEEPAEVVVRQIENDETEPAMTVANGRMSRPTSGQENIPSVDAPQIPVAAGSNASLKGLFAAPLSTPKLGTPVSHGVVPAVLEQQTPPFYPALARSMRVQGPVVLDIIVQEDGTVMVSRAVSGHPLLIQAAIDAVKQWHYRPAQLNGKTIKVETQVTVNFRLG